MSIDDKGKVFINKDEIQTDLLEFNLQAAKAKNPDVRVQLQADNGVNYGEVAERRGSRSFQICCHNVATHYSRSIGDPIYGQANALGNTAPRNSHFG